MINKYIDHTLLNPLANKSDYLKLACEATQFNLKAICVPPVWVSICIDHIQGSGVQLATVVGFPLGYNLTEHKVNEVSDLKTVVDEIDFVTNISWVKSKKFDLVFDEFKAIKQTAGNLIVKAILETGALSHDEISKLCELAVKSELDFIKTSTGFYKIGAQVNDVQLIKSCVGDSIKIKASGGIKDYKTAMSFINAGANRLGCSSSLTILKEEQTLINQPAEIT